MTASRQHTRPASWIRITAIAAVRVRRANRTRLTLAALIMTLLPWTLVDSHALATRLASLAEFTLVGLTVVAAGALSDDIDSGEYAILRSHDCSALQVLAGQAAASCGLSAGLVALQLPIALAGTPLPRVAPMIVALAWLAALLAGWVALMLFLATLLEGKANAVAMAAILAIIPFLLAGGIVDRLPHPVASIAGFALRLLPQLEHVSVMFRGLFSDVPPTHLAPVVLLASPFVYFGLALVRLERLEPAGRLNQ